MFHPRWTLRRNAQAQSSAGSRQIVQVIWTGTSIVMAGLSTLLLMSIILFHNYYLLNREYIGVGALLYLGAVGIMIRRNHYKSAAWMLVALYTVLSGFILVTWGINAPIGTLMLAFVIFLAGILLGANYIVPITLGAVCLLVVLYCLSACGITHPDRSSLTLQPSLGNILIYATIFGIYALIARLSKKQTERALQQAYQAEIALEKEKDSLKERLDEQTRVLREAQLDEMRQLYRFAEIGQLTTVMLHELANYLSVLTLDVDDLNERSRPSKAMARVKESIRYLDGVVDDLRKRLKASHHSQRFNAVHCIRETVEGLQPKAIRRNIKLELSGTSERRSYIVLGDPLRLSQCLTILINNAVDAYGQGGRSPAKMPNIRLSLSFSRHVLHISVIDYGPGIPANIRTALFAPLQSAKKNGMGIGLFITKQIIETHFKGAIRLDARHDRTEFIISLPEYIKKT